MAFTKYEGPDQVFSLMLQPLYDLTQSYSSLAGRLAAADGDRDKAVTEFMNSSDDPQAVKLRTQIETLQAKLKELADKKVVTEELSEEDREKLKSEMDTLKGKIRAGHDAITNGVKVMGQDPEGILAALQEIGDPTKSGRGRKPGQAGSSLPRVRALVTVTGGNLKDEVYDSFSKVALALSCEVKDLQVKFAEAAGVAHEEIKSVNKPVTFKFTPNHPNASEYTLVTTPKETAKPGPKPAAASTPAEPTKSDSDESKTEAA